MGGEGGGGNTGGNSAPSRSASNPFREGAGTGVFFSGTEGSSDWVSYAGFSSENGQGITLDLSISGAQEGVGGDTLSNIENVIGSEQDDSIKGNSKDSTFQGGKGQNTLDGRNGADTYVIASGDTGTGESITDTGRDGATNAIRFIDADEASNFLFKEGSLIITVTTTDSSGNTNTDTVKITDSDSARYSY